jgi:hypothetical protein
VGDHVIHVLLAGDVTLDGHTANAYAGDLFGDGSKITVICVDYLVADGDVGSGPGSRKRNRSADASLAGGAGYEGHFAFQ